MKSDDSASLHLPSRAFLIYGLPKQNIITMAQRLAKVISANPDRIAIYNYAHMPHIFKSQRRIAEDELPSVEAKLDMLFLCIKRLIEARYVYIGMDHFAKPEDNLAVAQRQGRLHRNFQGYSTYAESDLISCGVSRPSALSAQVTARTRKRLTPITNVSTKMNCRLRAVSGLTWTTCCAAQSSKC